VSRETRTGAQFVATDSRAAEVLSFWFRGPEKRKAWFEKDPAFDAAIRDRFLPLYEAAAGGALAPWVRSPGDCLALVVVLDQFPRNMFRGSARAFAADPLARDCANQAIALGFDKTMLPVERQFLYLPLEHSESLADQKRCLELMREIAVFPETADLPKWAQAHLDIIRRFGRFPHRNAALGRESTAAEIAFLREPGSSF
jgi:uncharacterized protein (DUF924 family)